VNRQEANNLLDEHKYGIKAHSIVEVTKALWVTNDLKGLPKHTRPFSQDGIDQWMESSRMAQSQGTGQPSNRDMERDKSGFNRHNEKFTK